MAAELLSNYYISLGGGDFGLAAILATTVFYLFQALLPFTLICYIVTLHDNKMNFRKKMLLPGLATFLLIGLVLINPFTEKLFYFDLAEGYVEGPWYKLMYYSAILSSGCCFVPYYNLEEETWFSKSESASGDPCDIRWRSDHSAFEPFLLTTGFGVSLSILALFITINNPYANMDSLTGLYNQSLSDQKRE